MKDRNEERNEERNDEERKKERKKEKMKKCKSNKETKETKQENSIILCQIKYLKLKIPRLKLLQKHSLNVLESSKPLNIW